MSLTVHAATGLLAGVIQVTSPFHDARPDGAVVDLIIVHGISLPPAEFGGPWIERLFTGNLVAGVHPYIDSILDLRVSAHAVIRRDGEVLQFVPFHRRAWHAGASTWCGRNACNDFSIGIELEGADDLPYEDAQYAALADLIRALCAAYPALDAARLVGHSDVAPGRKTDPGPSFDWPRLRAALADAVSASSSVPST